MKGETGNNMPKPHKRGSEKRQKQLRITTRLTWQEHAQFAANAAKAGLTIPSYIREIGIAGRETKSRVRRSVDADASMKLIAAMNRVGNNINQIVKHSHLGEPPLIQEYRDALLSLNEAVAAVLAVYDRRRE